MAISVDEIANEIVRELKTYTTDVINKVEKAKVDVAKAGVKELKSAGRFENVSGDYRKGWTSKKDGNVRVIHNKTDYQLTHLLEKGHVIKNGTGRTYGKTRKFPHIKSVEEKVVKEFLSRVEEAIEP